MGSASTDDREPTTVTGILELGPDRNGRLRDPEKNFRVNPKDPVIDPATIKAIGLRSGAEVTIAIDPGASPGEVVAVEGRPFDAWTPRRFEDLTPIEPGGRIPFEIGAEPLALRVVDLFTPIACGQRGLIIAPPRAGKTILLQQMAQAVTRNRPDIATFLVLIDERPEEVTEMRRADHGATVLASSNDREYTEHIRLAELAFDRGRRIAEAGGDALIFLDSLTRLARAYNKDAQSGRTMSGGVDIKAMDRPKRLFGAARRFEEGGSLTVLATGLVQTESRMDDLIFREFQGTGNMELVLDRGLAEKRIWPAIDVTRSGTRREERILDPSALERIGAIRRTLHKRKPDEALTALLGQLSAHPTNAAFLETIGGALNEPG